jgi:hypothetical protein
MHKFKTENYYFTAKKLRDRTESPVKVSCLGFCAGLAVIARTNAEKWINC